MCLKYFVAHLSCNHHEYLGSYHCRTTPCDLHAQHFHYIEDNFPTQLTAQADSRMERATSMCHNCVAKNYNKLDPDEVSVQYYPPTNNFNVTESRQFGYPLPIRVVKAEPGAGESEDCDYSYDSDYKSLSDADEDEWDTVEGQNGTTNMEFTHSEMMMQVHRGYVQKQLKDLSSYLTQQRQTLPFGLPGLQGPTPEAYAIGAYPHYSMPYIAHLAPSPVSWLPQCHGSVQGLSSTHTVPMSSTHEAIHAVPPPTQKAIVIPTTPVVAPHRPDTPPPTPPTQHPLPPRPPSEFTVGNITDAYLRIEAAKRRHMRERARRAKSLLRDALPARSMALTDFMVQKRASKGHHRDVDAVEEAELEMWSYLPFAGVEPDTGGGAEEYTGIAST